MDGMLINIAIAAASFLAPQFLDKYGPANDEGPRVVGAVIVVGNRKVPTAKVMESIRTRPGQEYSDAVAQDDVVRLVATRQFKRVKSVRTEPIWRGRVRVIFDVQEHPQTVREVVYLHAKHIAIEDLNQITKVRAGMPMDTCLNMLACYEIRDDLRQRGYFFANVSMEEGYLDSDDRLVINITEGPRVRIGDVRFYSRTKLALGKELAKQIDAHKNAAFRPESINDDVIKLQQYYRNEGYVDARVTRELDFSDNFAHVDVTFHVSEGKRYRIAEWSLTANNKTLRDALTRIVKVKKGDYCTQAAIDQDVKNMNDWGGWRGKPLDVQPCVLLIPEKPGFVRIQFDVEDRPVAYVGEVIIVGNTVTRDDVVRKQIKLYPGQVLQYPELRLAEKRLAKLGIFELNPETGKRPTVTVLDSPGQFKDILVKVEETRTGTLTIGVGVNSNGGLALSLTVEERNFDPRRWPTSMAEIRDGRAFRGGGQYLRLQLLPTPAIKRRAD